MFLRTLKRYTQDKRLMIWSVWLIRPMLLTTHKSNRR